MNRHSSTTGLRQQRRRNDQDQRPKQSSRRLSIQHLAKKEYHSLLADACDSSSCIGETAYQSPCGRARCERREDRKFPALVHSSGQAYATSFAVEGNLRVHLTTFITARYCTGSIHERTQLVTRHTLVVVARRHRPTRFSRVVCKPGFSGRGWVGI
jgi:hypothetical protein